MMLRYFTPILFLACYAAADFKLMQISDFHFDANYSRNGDPKNMCHGSGKTRANRVVLDQSLGVYGDYMCDSPLQLVQNAVQSAAKMFQTPYLILWTGDNVPHIDDYDQQYSLNALNITTEQLKQAFPNAQILPTYGNHDQSPPNQFAEDDDLYVKTYDMWKDWIGEDAKDTFLKGAYYAFNYQGTLFLVLNTNLYYNVNKIKFKDPEDPAGQFKFTEDQLTAARKNNVPVHIVAHIPPGAYERKAGVKWLTDKYNARFLKIVKQYQDVIKTMIFGHHHTDTFHLVRDDKGSPFQVCYISPAVTPWYSGWGEAANNPSFRIYNFDSNKTWILNDIETYYVDLTALNKDKNTSWKLEYSFKKAYNLADFSAQSFDRLLDRMDKDDKLYLDYLKYNSVLYDQGTTINETLRLGQMCSLRHSDYDDYTKCLNTKSAGERANLLSVFVLFVVFFGMFSG